MLVNFFLFLKIPELSILCVKKWENLKRTVSERIIVKVLVKMEVISGKGNDQRSKQERGTRQS